MVDPKRRLPVLKSASADGDLPIRPSWQWILFETLLILVVWVLLAALVTFFAGMAERAIVQRTEASFLLYVTVPHVAALALASSFGAHLVGRYGGATAGFREAVAGAVLAGLVGVLFAWSGTTYEKLVRTATVLFVTAVTSSLSARRAIRRREVGAP